MGWTTAKLGEVAQVQTGPFGSQLHVSDYVENGTPIITVENLIDNKIKYTPSTPQVASKDVTRLSKYTLREGDVVFSRVGAVDRSAYCTEEADGWMFSGRLLRVRPKSSVSSKYLNYYLSLEAIKNHIRNHAVGGTMASLNTSILNSIPVVYPTIDMQKKIVEVLEVWDKYLERLDRKIELKEEVRRALESRLLSGRVRLPGFHKAWKKCKVRDIFSFIGSYSHSKDQMSYEPGNERVVHNIHYGDIHKCYTDYIDVSIQRIPFLLNAKGISNVKLLVEGDVIVADASEDYAGVGECVEVINLAGRKCIAGLHTLALRPKVDTLAPGFGALLFKNSNVHNSMKQIATYSKVYGVTKHAFESTDVYLPEYEEQVILARIIDTNRNEIDKLRKSRDLLTHQREYLLKNLMTGKIKLKQEHDNARER